MNELLNSGINAAFGDFDASDYLGLASYDIRVKFYITPKINMVGRFFITGINSDSYNYSIGLTVKL
jgi:hypothetical protein